MVAQPRFDLDPVKASNLMARGVHGGNESAGGIDKILGAGRVSGAQPAGYGSKGAAVRADGDRDINARAAEVGRTEGENPGQAPHRGLTVAGVVEKFIQGTMGQSSLTPNPGPIPTSFVPTALLKK
jgi:hypothetical protein